MANDPTAVPATRTDVVVAGSGAAALLDGVVRAGVRVVTGTRLLDVRRGTDGAVTADGGSRRRYWIATLLFCKDPAVSPVLTRIQVLPATVRAPANADGASPSG